MKGILTSISVKSEIAEVKSMADYIGEEIDVIQENLKSVDDNLKHVDEEAIKRDTKLFNWIVTLKNALKMENELRVKKQEELLDELDNLKLWLSLLSIVGIIEFFAILALFFLK